MRFQRFPVAAAIFLAAAFALGAETLWTPGFQGYLSSNTTVRPGDILTVVVDSASSLSFEASSSDAKSITLEFAGGEFGNLFSFLPAGRTGGNQSVAGGSEYALSSEIAVRVVESDAAGNVRLEGTRAVSLQGREEELVISGWLDPGYLGASRAVGFSRLADSRLSFRTFLQPSAPILTSADIEEVVTALEAQVLAETEAEAGSAAGAAPGAAAVPPAGAGAVGVPGALELTRPLTTYTLTADKKTELFLRYINRLVDILFQ